MNVRIMADSPIRFPGLFGDWAFTGSSVAFHIGGKAIYWYGILNLEIPTMEWERR